MTHPIYLSGAAGRMGTALAECIAQADDIEIAGAFEAPGHPWIGKPLGAEAPCEVLEFPQGAPGAQRVTSIHFTWPEATLPWLEWSARHRCPLVIGTTGFDQAQIDRIGETAQKTPIVFAPNMSVGVNMLFALTRKASETLGRDFDIEIVEIHHRFKKDAPSGTATRLGQIAAEGIGADPERDGVHGRKGMVGERPSGQIGFHALRGGDVVGEHTVVFAGMGERLELTHRAASRRTFAEGALRAVRFLADKDSGLYDMQDVLGLK